MEEEIISLSKTRLSDPQIQNIVSDFLGHSPQKLQIRELTYGLISAVYHVVTSEGQWVIKVSARPSVKVLRCERGMIDAEAIALNLLSNYSYPIRIPKVHKFDQSCRLVEVPYVIMDHLPGENLDMVRKHLNQSDQHKIDQSIGRHLRFCNDISHIRPDGVQPPRPFGFFATNSPRYSTWREAFSAFIFDLLSDAEDAQVPDIPHEDIKDVLAAHASALDEVTEAKLVGWDIWDGNLLVSYADSENRSGAFLSGSFDYDRALWGDPLMENNFYGLLASPALIEAYGAFKSNELTSGQRTRRLLYDLHANLVFVIGGTIRGNQDKEKDWIAQSRRGIRTSLDSLKMLTKDQIQTL